MTTKIITAIEAIRHAQGWTEADWTHEAVVDGHTVYEEDEDGERDPVLCDGHIHRCETCREAGRDAEQASEYGDEAIGAIEAGDFDEALRLVKLARDLEDEYGDSPSWTPAEVAVEALVEDDEDDDEDDDDGVTIDYAAIAELFVSSCDTTLATRLVREDRCFDTSSIIEENEALDIHLDPVELEAALYRALIESMHQDAPERQMPAWADRPPTRAAEIMARLQASPRKQDDISWWIATSKLVAMWLAKPGRQTEASALHQALPRPTPDERGSCVGPAYDVYHQIEVRLHSRAMGWSTFARGVGSTGGDWFAEAE